MRDRVYHSPQTADPPLECTIVHRETSAALEIGQRVRDARKALGLRQDELALAAGVSTRLIHEIERGKPTSRFDGLVRVLGALGLTLEVVERTPKLAPRDDER